MFAPGKRAAVSLGEAVAAAGSATFVPGRRLPRAALWLHRSVALLRGSAETSRK